MTPQERKLIDDLFDRLASLENNPRDPDAVSAMRDGLQRAPNALYPLVQTALVQDEALKRAHARIEELEDELGIEPGEPAKQPGFLDSMRDALLGTPQGSGPQGSVPSVRPGATAGAPGSPWRTTTVQQPGGYPGGGYGAEPPGYGAQPVGAGGGSFLGTAAATVAGVVGGALLMNSFRGMFGGQHMGQNMGQSAFGSGQSGTPWGGDASGSDMARDAGLNDIGRGGGDSGGSQHAGLFDASSDDGGSNDDSGDFDVGGDSGGGDSSDT